MDISNKFHPGQTVYLVNCVKQCIVCSWCSGNGEMKVDDGTIIQCPRNGCVSGRIQKSRYTPKCVELVSITIDKTGMYYEVDGEFYSESKLCVTKEDAQAKCDRRNADE